MKPTTAHHPLSLCLIFTALAWSTSQLNAASPGTAFTYQGRLTDAGAPATGIYDLRFTIYDSTNSPGTLIAGPLTNSATSVSNGWFTVALDFGDGVFTGSARWLEIGVRANGAPVDFTTLAPRQPLTPTPYALYAPGAGVAETATTAGTASNVVSGSIGTVALAPGAVDSSRIAAGAIVSSNLSPALLANTFWRLGGNSGTVPGTNFLGTTGNEPLEIKVNNQRALRVEPNSYGAPNWIGGSSINSIDEGVAGATIGGGGALNLFGWNYTNRVAGFLGTIAGGGGNTISSGADMSAIGGGYYNTLEGTFSAVIAGGGWNSILSEASFSAVGGGQYNSIQPGSSYSTIAGGVQNLIGTNASNATVGGGGGNRIDTFASDTVIAGGGGNTIGPEAVGAAIGGGGFNEIQKSAADSTITGGKANIIHSNTLYSTISGGRLNAIQTNAGSSAIAGGENNAVGANASYTTIAGGGYNQVGHDSINSVIGGGMMSTIGANAANGTISGGGANIIEDNAIWSTIGGGINNDIGTNAMSTTIAGGRMNAIDYYAVNATIGGGFQNRIQAYANGAALGAGENNTIGFAGSGSTISGGSSNTVGFNSKFATIPGGKLNVAAADYTLAAGRRARANHPGAFVWADSTDANFTSTSSNQFLIRAGGGIGINTNNPQSALHVAGTVTAEFFSGSGAGLTAISGTALADGSVTSSKIVNGAVGSAQLASGAVQADNIAAGSVTTSSLADGAVTASKVATVDYTRLLSTLTNPTPAVSDYFGISVAALGDDCLLIGAYGDDTGATNAGAAYLFSTSGTLLTTFTNPTPAVSDSFGYSVAAVGNQRVLIGAYGDDTGATDAGAAYLFSTNGTLLITFTNPAPADSDYFGRPVAAMGSDRVLIAAYRDDTGASNAGSVYLFSTNGTLLTTFTNPTPAVDDFFGFAVAAVGSDRVIIGAFWDDTGATDSGAAYLFSTNGTLLITFTNPTPAIADSFGYSVAVLGSERVIIGAEADDTGATDAGAAYLFSTNGTLLITFTNPAPADGDLFGRSVAAVGSDRVLIGAEADDSGAANAGSAYLFSINGALLTTVTNPIPASLEYFGGSVAAVGSGQVLISARADNTGAVAAGAAYLFSIESFSPGLVADAVRDRSVTTASLEDGTVTPAKLDAAIGIWTRSSANVFRETGNVGIGTNSPQQKLHVIGNILASGTVTGSSDRDVKQDFAPVDSCAVLEKVAAMPITTWRYIADADVRHLGPVAQDFYAAFQVGMDNKHISMVDADGVALAAIQGLNRKVEEQRAENAELKRRLERLEQLLGQQSRDAP